MRPSSPSQASRPLGRPCRRAGTASIKALIRGHARIMDGGAGSHTRVATRHRSVDPADSRPPDHRAVRRRGLSIRTHMISWGGLAVQCVDGAWPGWGGRAVTRPPPRARRARPLAVLAAGAEAAPRLRVTSAPVSAGTYQLIACLRTRCTTARRPRVAVVAVERDWAPSPTPTPSASPADVVPPRPAASPLKVTLTPGTTKSSATIGADGGTVVAAAGGFEFTLTIPKGALAARRRSPWRRWPACPGWG